MRSPAIAVILAALAAAAQATTLQKLTMYEMIRQSTAIVHAKVVSSSTAMRGTNVYTFYQLQVMETLKSPALSQVAVPGGSAGRIRQDVTGAPALAAGGEYVFFLWTSRSGLTQIIGLSQGLFNVTKDSTGNAVLVRPAMAGTITLDESGHVRNTAAVTISLNGLEARIQHVMGAAQ